MPKTTLPLILTAFLGATAAAGAQETSEAIVTESSGPALYKGYCASCHGPSAKGDGPIAHALRFQPADLTQIAKRSEGRFERDKVHRMIDGRNPVKGHGGTDMPLWGDAFKRSGTGFSEEAVSRRIDLLVEYLEGLQEK
ncbi:MAG TPA: c-type cytochrome [Vicinamibacteria bacterium]|nr:c-type cytochrome [Vicinamibacteria bacterium]